MADATLTFVSSLQRGMSVGLADVDSVSVPAHMARAVVNLQLTFSPIEKAIVDLSLVGPGDIVGLDTRTIVRTYPRPNDNDAEFEHFAMVEFDQADLPWRYTPAKPAGSAANKTDKLRPWLTLIVLVEGDELASDDYTPASPKQKLPLVAVRRKHLPAEGELWAWAHLQLNESVTDAAALEGALGGARGRLVARVISARILKKQTAYHVFLVPTFERGRRIISGEDLTNVDALAPAWRRAEEGTPGADEKIRLPVYYEWRFQTGTAGSFESLISALVPRPLPPSVGRRSMDVSDPGLKLPAPAAAPMAVSGALQSVPAAAIVDPPPEQVFIDELKTFVDISEILAKDEDGVERMVKVVSPPLYGRWYAAQSALVTPPPWFFSLNSDPRHRVAAGLGTLVVQREQQSLMEAAWRQIDQLRSVNYERKVLQTAREAFGQFMLRHINIGFAQTKLALTGKLHGRILSGTDTTVFARFAQSPLGHDFFDPQWRRFTSARGILARRLGLPNLPVGQDPGLFGRINDGVVQLAPTPPTPTGVNDPETVWGSAVSGDLTGKQLTDLATQLGKDRLVFWGLLLFWVGRRLLIDLRGQFWWLLHPLIKIGFALVRLANDPELLRVKIREGLRIDALTPAQVSGAPAAPAFTIRVNVSRDDPSSLPTDAVLLPPAGALDSSDAVKFRSAATGLFQYLTRGRGQPTLTKVDLAGAIKAIMDGIEPSASLVESHKDRLSFDTTTWKAKDLLEPIQAAPEFDRPMYEPLRAISDEWILPGLSEVPENTVALTVTNQRFVEAFMVGVNHEMTRELIWNEYPVDQRATYFRQFWDARSFVDGPGNNHTGETLKDIQAIRSWPSTADLGANSSRPAVEEVGDPRVVLLVRGQLIKRYPNVIVYAATSAVRDPPPEGYQERHPVFHGFLGGDVAYYAFDLKLSQVRDADDPWFFILQEQPAEPRFGVPDGVVPAGEPPYARVHNEFFDDAAAAKVALHGLRRPTRVAVKGSTLVLPL